MEKEWRPVPGFPAYQIRNDGKLRKADTHYGLSVGSMARLWADGQRHKVAVADLVEAAFPVKEPQPPQPEPEPEHIEWLPLEYLPGLEINRRGEVRGIESKTPRVRQKKTPYGDVSYVQIQVGKSARTATVNVLLEETFGHGAAAAAGFPVPNMEQAKRVRRRWNGEEPEPPKSFAKPGRFAAKRRCHDCGRPTSNYRCAACWARIRGSRTAESDDPMNW